MGEVLLDTEHLRAGQARRENSLRTGGAMQKAQRVKCEQCKDAGHSFPKIAIGICGCGMPLCSDCLEWHCEQALADEVDTRREIERNIGRL